MVRTTQVKPVGRLYAWFIVFVLILAYTFSYIDRTVLTLMVDPIRASLHISDVQLSLLHGLAFAIFYTVLGIPIGQLIDRSKRTRVIAVGIAVWSLMTAFCGLARNFGQLFAARIGVGAGEAALSPAAYSMISDTFKGKELVVAMSCYSGAIYIGSGLATMIAGSLIAQVSPMELPIVGHMEPWQLVFMLVGIPGLLIAVLVASLREPARTGLAKTDTMPGIGQVLRHMARKGGAYIFLILGLAFASLMWNSMTAWIPSHFKRQFGWSTSEIGSHYGLGLLVFGTAGILFGSWLSAGFRDRGHKDANVRVMVVSALLALPAGIAGALMPNAMGSLTALCAFLFFGAMPYGSAGAALQDITPNRMRGQVIAIYLFFINATGIGFGPTAVALFTEHLFGGDMGVSKAMALTVAIAAPVSAFFVWLACKPYRHALTETEADALDNASPTAH